MYKYEIKNYSLIRKCIEAITSIIDEAEFELNPDNVSIVCMDASRIALIELKLGEDCFSQIEHDKQIKIGFNAQDLAKIMVRISNPENSSLEFDTENRTIKITATENGRKRTFKLSQISTDIEEVPIGNLEQIEYDNSVSLLSSDLLDVLKDCEIYSEIFTIKTFEPNVFNVKSIGQIGEAEVELEIDGKEFTETDCSFSNKYFKDLLSKLSNVKAELFFTKGTPAFLHFETGEDSYLNAWIAPRVDEEEEIDDTEFD